MSVQALTWVLDHSDVRGYARLVLISIANHADHDGTGSYPSYETIAQEAGVSRRHVVRMVAQLEAGDHVTVVRKGSPVGTNLYRILGVPQRRRRAASDHVSPRAGNAGDRGSPPAGSQATEGPGDAVSPGVVTDGHPGGGDQESPAVVTSGPAAGDKSGPVVTEPVTRTVHRTVQPEPSTSLAAPRPWITSENGHRRDLLFEAVMDACAIALADIPGTARGAYNRAVEELRDMGASPDEVHRRAHNAWFKVTPTALVRRWAELDSAPQDGRPKGRAQEILDEAVAEKQLLAGVPNDELEETGS